MEQEHAAIDPLLDAIDAAVADRDSGPARLGDLTDALVGKLTDHLKHEEDETLPLIETTLTPEQLQNFGRVHAGKAGPDGPRITPWMLDRADEHVVASTMAILPPPVLAAYQDEWLPAYAALDRWSDR